LPINKRVTVRIKKVERHVEVELADRYGIPEYWGYAITVEKYPFGKLVKSGGFDLSIATSKYGAPFAESAEKIAQKWKGANTVLLAFGAPARGLYKIVENEGLCLDDVVDFVINTIPMQGTETVRTEEALIASLAILNAQFRFKV
jgi:predicted SPOUT superfamily RNA methylase MTH1